MIEFQQVIGGLVLDSISDSDCDETVVAKVATSDDWTGCFRLPDITTREHKNAASVEA